MNILSNQDKEQIISHFKDRLLKRYQITGDKYELQKIFRRRVQSSIQLEVDRRDKNKAIYVTRYQNKKVLFVYNQEIKLVKTALTL